MLWFASLSSFELHKFHCNIAKVASIIHDLLSLSLSGNQKGRRDLLLSEKLPKQLTEKRNTRQSKADRFRVFQSLILSLSICIKSLMCWSFSSEAWILDQCFYFVIDSSRQWGSGSHWDIPDSISTQVDVTRSPIPKFHSLYLNHAADLLNLNLCSISDELEYFTPPMLCQIKLSWVTQNIFFFFPRSAECILPSMVYLPHSFLCKRCWASACCTPR